VAAGVVILNGNSKPAIQGTGTGGALSVTTSAFAGNDAPLSLFTVYDFDTTASSRDRHFGLSSAGSAALAWPVNVGNYRFFKRDDANVSRAGLDTVAPTAGVQLLSHIDSGTAVNFWESGAQKETNRDSNIGQMTITGLALIQGVGANTNIRPISEVIAYTSNQSSNRTGIEANIANFHGITLP